MNKERILSGIRWTLLTSVLSRLVTLLLYYFLAKWLTKEDLGVFRTYNLLLVFFTSLTQLGLDYHYITEKRRIYSALQALLGISLLAAAVWFILLSGGAGVLGKLYQSHMLLLMFRYTAIFAVVELLRRFLRALAQKHLQFRQLALAETANALFYSVFAIILLYFYRTVWVYLILFYLGNLVEVLYLAFVNKGKLRALLRTLSFSRLRLTLKRNLLHYRSFLSQATAVSAINQFSGNAPILLLGTMVSPALIGVYFLFSQLVGMPVSIFTVAVNQVFFPVFSAQESDRIKSTVSQYLALVLSVGLPVLACYGYLLNYGIKWFLGDKWIAGIPLIPFLVIIYGSNLFSASLGGIPFARRKPGWELIWNIAAFVLRITALLIGVQYSFYWAVILFAFAGAVMNLSFLMMCAYLVNLKLTEVGFEIAKGLLPLALYLITLYLLSSFAPWLAVAMALLVLTGYLAMQNQISEGKVWRDLKYIAGFR